MTKKLIIIVALLLVAAFVGGKYYADMQGHDPMANNPLVKQVKNADLSDEERLELLRVAYTEGSKLFDLPFQLDPYTVLETMEKNEEDYSILYSYTITGIADDVLKASKPTFKDQSMQVLCNVPQSRMLLESGIKMIWIYNNKDGETLFENDSSGGC